MILGCYDTVSSLHRVLKMEGKPELAQELLNMDGLDRTDCILTAKYNLPKTSDLRMWIDKNIDMADYGGECDSDSDSESDSDDPDYIPDEDEEDEEEAAEAAEAEEVDPRDMSDHDVELNLNTHWTDVVGLFVKLGANYVHYSLDILDTMKMYSAMGYATVRDLITLPELGDSTRAAIRTKCPEYKRLCIFNSSEHVRALHTLALAVTSKELDGPLPDVSADYKNRHIPLIKTKACLELAERIYHDYTMMKDKLVKAVKLYEKMSV